MHSTHTTQKVSAQSFAFLRFCCVFPHWPVCTMARSSSSATTTKSCSQKSYLSTEDSSQREQSEVQSILKGNGTRIPRKSFLQLSKNRRFDEICDILDRPEEYDLESWLLIKPTSGVNKRKISRRRSAGLRRLRGGSSNGLEAFHTFRGETPLHMIVHYQPTEEVVDKLIVYLKEHSSVSANDAVPEDVSDNMGRTPLHVGAANGCPVLTMTRLCSGVSGIMPAVAKDSMGRHALHWACTYPHGKPDDDSKSVGLASLNCCERKQRFHSEDFTSMETDNMVQVVYLLLKSYPEAVAIEDANGFTPIHLARQNHADKRIIKILVKALLTHPQKSGPLCELVQTLTGSTPPTEEPSDWDEQVPIEVTESSDYYNDDEVSSIGITGASLMPYNHVPERKVVHGKQKKPWALRVEKIEEEISL